MGGWNRFQLKLDRGRLDHKSCRWTACHGRYLHHPCYTVHTQCRRGSQDHRLYCSIACIRGIGYDSRSLSYNRRVHIGRIGSNMVCDHISLAFTELYHGTRLVGLYLPGGGPRIARGLTCVSVSGSLHTPSRHGTACTLQPRWTRSSSSTRPTCTHNGLLWTNPDRLVRTRSSSALRPQWSSRHRRASGRPDLSPHGDPGGLLASRSCDRRPHGESAYHRADGRSRLWTGEPLRSWYGRQYIQCPGFWGWFHVSVRDGIAGKALHEPQSRRRQTRLCVDEPDALVVHELRLRRGHQLCDRGGAEIQIQVRRRCAGLWRDTGGMAARVVQRCKLEWQDAYRLISDNTGGIGDS